MFLLRVMTTITKTVGVLLHAQKKKKKSNKTMFLFSFFMQAVNKYRRGGGVRGGVGEDGIDYRSYDFEPSHCYFPSKDLLTLFKHDFCYSLKSLNLFIVDA